MLRNVLVTGAAGLIGTAVVARLRARGHRVAALPRAPAGGVAGPSWDPETGRVCLDPTVAFDAVVHLAGASIARRWTPAVKARIRASRGDATRRLSEALIRLPHPPRVLVCASATGYYGDRPGEVLEESSGPGRGFLAETCVAWEAATEPARESGMRVVSLRLGIVLAGHGGALAGMLPAFRWGLGGRLGSGRQFWSWITLEDAVRVVELALQEEGLRGAVNTVAPGADTQAGFTATLARTLGRPAVLPLPAFAVRVLFGEMGREALLASARVRPARLIEAGFKFNSPGLEEAFRQALGAAPGGRAGPG